MKKCIYCKKEIVVMVKSKYKGKSYVYYNSGKDSKFCSLKCYHSYSKGRPLTGRALENSRVSIRKAIDARKNNLLVREKWLLRMREVTLGSKNHKWVEDRSKLVNQDGRNGFKYLKWRKLVIIRDGYKCKINNGDCDDCLEVHHIIAWRNNNNLHYKLTNGITLCRTHHPRVRSEEKRLIPYFKGLVSVSKKNI